MAVCGRVGALGQRLVRVRLGQQRLGVAARRLRARTLHSPTAISHKHVRMHTGVSVGARDGSACLSVRVRVRVRTKWRASARICGSEGRSSVRVYLIATSGTRAATMTSSAVHGNLVLRQRASNRPYAE
jgi:hypothetical protein